MAERGIAETKLIEHFGARRRLDSHQRVLLQVCSNDAVPTVDLIVPDAVAPPGGRRSARIAPHGRQSARKAVGLEAAIVDHSPMTIAAPGLTPMSPYWPAAPSRTQR